MFIPYEVFKKRTSRLKQYFRVKLYENDVFQLSHGLKNIDRSKLYQ